MRKALIIAAFLILIIFGAAGIIAENVSGSGAQAATFDRIEISADPSIQGLGGEITVTVTAYFYGGCCYSLFANDIVPELVIPEGLNVSSGPTPEIKNSLTAVAGGEPTTCSFKWVLSCDNKGSYDLHAKVDSSDCGAREGDIQVHVIKGATISSPQIYPIKVSDTGEKITPSSDDVFLKFSAGYAVGDIDVISASVFFFDSSSEMESEFLTVEGNSIYYQNEEIGKGEQITCSMDENEEGLFHSSIPKTSEDYLYFWIEVVDENENITTSSIYILNVENVEEVNTWNMISFMFLVVTMIILIAILYAGQNILKKRMDGVESEDRFSVLGPVGRKRYLTDEEDASMSVKVERNWRYILVGGIILIALITALYFILSGDGETLFNHFLEGK